VHAYLARRVGAGRADDLAAATFTVAFERRGAFRETATSARPWLFGIATNLLRNEWRAEQRALEALARLVPAAVDPAGIGGGDHAGPGSTDGTLLGLGLAELDADQRDVLLYAWEGLSYEEIAASLGVPIGTVRSRLARARARLRSRLMSERPARAHTGEEQEMDR
jgi:RNA polymerase sigma-70 factor (ECF subfamily)